jgi:hypothetical protein
MTAFKTNSLVDAVGKNDRVDLFQDRLNAVLHHSQRDVYPRPGTHNLADILWRPIFLATYVQILLAVGIHTREKLITHVRNPS